MSTPSQPPLISSVKEADTRLKSLVITRRQAKLRGDIHKVMVCDATIDATLAIRTDLAKHEGEAA